MAIDKTKNHPSPTNNGDITQDRKETLGMFLRKGEYKPIGTGDSEPSIEGRNNSGIEGSNRYYVGRTSEEVEIPEAGVGISGTKSFIKEHGSESAVSKFDGTSYHEGEATKPFDIPEKGRYDKEAQNAAYQQLNKATTEVMRRGLSKLLQSNRFQSITESGEDLGVGGNINGGFGKQTISSAAQSAFAPEVQTGEKRERSAELFSLQNPGTFNQEWQWRDGKAESFGKFNPEAKTFSSEQLSKLSLVLQIIATEDIAGKGELGNIPKSLFEKLKANVDVLSKGAALGGGFAAITDPDSGRIDLNRLQEIMQIADELDQAKFSDSLAPEGLYVNDQINKRTFSQLNSFQEQFGGSFNLPMITTGLTTTIILVTYAAVIGILLDLLLMFAFWFFIEDYKNRPFQPIRLPADGASWRRKQRRISLGSRRGYPLDYNEGAFGAIFGDDEDGFKTINLVMLLFKSLHVHIPEAQLRRSIRKTGGFLTFTTAAILGAYQLLKRCIFDSGGYLSVIGRQAIRDSSTIAQASAASSNPIEGFFNLIDTFKSSSTFRFVNVLFQLGDTFRLGDTDVRNDFTTGKIKYIPDGHPLSLEKMTDRSLSYSPGKRKSLYLLPSDVLRAADAASYVENLTPEGEVDPIKLESGAYQFINKEFVQFKAGADLMTQRVPAENTYGMNRFHPIQSRLIERNLEAEYMPFYFHDLRTGEIISFYAFLEGISDGFTANYTKVGGFGRMDPVNVYKDTQRAIALTFHVVAVDPEDFDAMWIKINKLTTLMYPQWSEGSVKQLAEGERFIQPFSQIPTSSPLIRMRVGDLFTSNMGEANLYRLYGISRILASEAGAFKRIVSEVVEAHNDFISSQSFSGYLDFLTTDQDDDPDYAVRLPRLREQIEKYGHVGDVKLVSSQGNTVPASLHRAAIQDLFGAVILTGHHLPQGPFKDNNNVDISLDGFSSDGWDVLNYPLQLTLGGDDEKEYVYLVGQMCDILDYDSLIPDPSDYMKKKGRTFKKEVSEKHREYAATQFGRNNARNTIAVESGIRYLPDSPAIPVYKLDVLDYKGRDAYTAKVKGEGSVRIAVVSTKAKPFYENRYVISTPYSFEDPEGAATPADDTRIAIRVHAGYVDFKINFKKVMANLVQDTGIAGTGLMPGSMLYQGRQGDEINPAEIDKYKKLLKDGGGVAGSTAFFQKDTGQLMDFDEFFGSNSTFFKAINSTSGRGLAGVITSMNFDWNKGTWEISPGSRAPKYCTVQINFSPIHDIAPGIAHDGFNRAPVYGVGPTMGRIQGAIGEKIGLNGSNLPPTGQKPELAIKDNTDNPDPNLDT